MSHVEKCVDSWKEGPASPYVDDPTPKSECCVVVLCDR